LRSVVKEEKRRQAAALQRGRERGRAEARPYNGYTLQSEALKMSEERLQKIMAGCGIASRRKAEEIIAAGRVTLNGKVVTEQGTKADPERDEICVDGKPLGRSQRLRYFVLNKPKGYVTTVSDPEGRPTVMDLLPNRGERVYPVGRLDYASEGLLLLTNDGAVAQKLTKAGSHVPKTYLVKISGKPDEKAIGRLRAGVTIELEDGRRVKTSPAKIRIVDVRREAREGRAEARPYKGSKSAEQQAGLAEDAANPWYEVVLMEGRNRQIRRMFETVGHHVEKIKRVQLGPVVLDVEPGKFRELTEEEVEKLKKVAGGETKNR
jgi:23S rRNA pseudouridine2605 synthase